MEQDTTRPHGPSLTYPTQEADDPPRSKPRDQVHCDRHDDLLRFYPHCELACHQLLHHSTSLYVNVLFFENVLVNVLSFGRGALFSTQGCVLGRSLFSFRCDAIGQWRKQTSIHPSRLGSRCPLQSINSILSTSQKKNPIEEFSIAFSKW